MAVETPEIAADRFLASFREPAHILVAVSGGSDSTGLLVTLAEGLKRASPSSAISLSAATIDHDLRPESGGEAHEVEMLCARLGVRHVIRRWAGEKPKAGLMAAAREARYDLLADIAFDIGADVIVTAHTFDDQQETLAMRAERRVMGEGMPATGIADAVLFDRRIWVLRPFLHCRRGDIRAYLRHRATSWIDDPSNEDPHYERVRTRRRLADDPATAFKDEGDHRALLAAKAAEWLDAHVAVHANVLCVIGREGLAADRAVLAYALSQLAAVFGGKAYGPGQAQLARVLDFLAEGRPDRRTVAGAVFDLRREGLYLMRESRGIAPLLLPPGSGAVWDGRFEVVNNGNVAILIEAGASAADFPLPGGMPKGAVARARAAAPRSSPAECGGQVSYTPRLAPFDRFLTSFDLAFADRLAALFARAPYRRPAGGLARA